MLRVPKNNFNSEFHMGMLSNPGALPVAKVWTISLSSSLTSGRNSKGWYRGLIRYSSNFTLGGVIIATKLGPILEKYLPKLLVIECGSNVSLPLFLKKAR